MRIPSARGTLLILFACTALASAQKYTVTDLGVIGGRVSVAVAVSDLGQVVGYSDVNDRTTAQHAFVWTAASGMQDLGTLGGNDSYASAVNNGGQVAGCSATSSSLGHAFLWTQSGGLQDLGTLGGSISCAHGMNDEGVVVGGSEDSAGSGRAFLWTASRGMQDLGVPNGIAYAINELGEVVGTFPASGGEIHSFLWTAAGGVQDLGSLGTGNTQASGISPSTVVVGQSQVSATDSNTYFGFRWTSSGGMIALAALFPKANANAISVNSSGEIVGSALDSNMKQRAVMWDLLSKIHDLNKAAVNSPLILQMATGINDSGQIIGEGQDKINPGLTHAFLLTPSQN